MKRLPTLLLCMLFLLPGLALATAEQAASTIDLTPLVNSAVVLLGALITAFVVPWLRQKYSAEKLDNIAYWVDVFVAAAEQMFTGQGRGEEKLKWVEKALADKGIKLDTEQVRALIEATIYGLKSTEPPDDPGNSA